MAAPPAKDVLLLDDPRPGVRRLTMNRPEKRNALNLALSEALFDALREADSAELKLRQSESCFLPDVDATVTATGQGAIFVATVG